MCEESKKEFLDIFDDVMDENGMSDRIYGEFKPSSFRCNIDGCPEMLKDEKDYLKHRKYRHRIK